MIHLLILFEIIDIDSPVNSIDEIIDNNIKKKRKNRTCLEKGCDKQPNFNTPDEKKGLYCSQHKKIGMIDVKHPTCEVEGCKKRPSFNTVGAKRGKYCSLHKSTKMVNVVDPTCKETGCDRIPAFNTIGQKKRLYCSLHKKLGMVDVKNATCSEEGCQKQPVYNTPDKKKGIYCSLHKKFGMIDVKNPTCHEADCFLQASFNTEGKKKGLYCSLHKKSEMINVLIPTCKTSLCLTLANKKYEGYCLYCYINLFPDKPVSRNYKTKEYAVVEYIKINFPDLDWIADKRVSDGCSRRRPDLLLDLGYQILIVEIDENQHTGYDCSCDNKRIMELSKDLGHRSIIFIRFNPDAYFNNETKISSCWGLNKAGLSIVKKSKKKEWEERLLSLKEQIEYWINPENITNKTIETVELFYDINKPED